MQSTSIGSLAGLRVDVVGSFLRPQALIDAFESYGADATSHEQLTAVQDTAIAEVLATQERHGMPVATDGEYRREVFMQSFSDVAGMEPWNDEIVRIERSRRRSEAVPFTHEGGTETKVPFSGVSRSAEIRFSKNIRSWRNERRFRSR